MNLKTVLTATGLTLAGMGMAVADGDPIKIPINEWTGQHISAHITGTLFEKAGYEVEYVTAGAVPQFAAIASGDLHLQPEVWTNNVGDIYPKAVESGDIVVVGPTGPSAARGLDFSTLHEREMPRAAKPMRRFMIARRPLPLRTPSPRVA